MRRILILHALLGTGHLSAAQALDAAFAHFPSVEAQVEDSLGFINPTLSSLWKKGYKELTRTPGKKPCSRYSSSAHLPWPG